MLIGRSLCSTRNVSLICTFAKYFTHFYRMLINSDVSHLLPSFLSLFLFFFFLFNLASSSDTISSAYLGLSLKSGIFSIMHSSHVPSSSWTVWTFLKSEILLSLTFFRRAKDRNSISSQSRFWVFSEISPCPSF